MSKRSRQQQQTIPPQDDRQDTPPSTNEPPITSIQPPGLGRTWPTVLGFTGIAFLALLAVLGLNAQYGAGIVHNLDKRLGKLQAEKGERLENAADYDGAEEAYRRALEDPSLNRKDRAFTLKHLGALLWWRKGPEPALPYLEESYKNPDHAITLYGVLCDCYVHLGKGNAAWEVAQRWLERAKQEKNGDQEAQAHYYAGQALHILGKDNEAVGHLEQFLQDAVGTQADQAKTLLDEIKRKG